MLDKKKWQLFFENAGLPASVAKEYSDIFIQNRITKDILPDLDRDILREMGINAIGDAMSILKQIKIAKEKVGQIEASVLNKLNNGFENTIQSLVTSTTPSANVKISHLPKVPVSNSRKFIPDIDGGYTVKLPQGTTPKTRQILEKINKQQSKETLVKAQSVARKRVVTVDLDEEDDDDDDGIFVTTSRTKKTRPESSNSTVFSRLGIDYQLSSTSSISTFERPNSPEKMQVLKRLVNHALGSSDNKSMDPTLKNRLGLKTQGSPPLEYRGVLKNRLSDPTPFKATAITFSSTTENMGGIFARHVEKHVKHRLG
ncbi:hypothetical protein Ciccas_006728 [Cichlidogyrus casuarinus]|uniref:SAM domain-containing protein n=1 Tax=Cichlidogyrus casuarinus TaxID=1844966 RepID=A0ABD2Q4X8_9PLAT